MINIHRELATFCLGLMAQHPGLTGTTVMNSAKQSLRQVSRRKRTAPSLPRHVLLIVEEFDDIRSVIGRDFARQGYEVFSSSTLCGALAIAWEETPQVIIVEYGLNGESSLRAIEHLRAAQPKSTIVLAGAPKAAEIEERAILAGASKVLSSVNQQGTCGGGQISCTHCADPASTGRSLSYRPVEESRFRSLTR